MVVAMKSLFLILCFFSLVLFSLHSESSVGFWISCPDDVTLQCHDDISDLSLYGNATYYSNYVINDAGTPDVKYFLNECNVGTIKRTWTVEDQYWNNHSCSQIITILGSGSSVPDIKWPDEEYSVQGCTPNYSPTITGYPSYQSHNICNMTAMNYDDTVFNFGPQCKKVIRTWTIIDWCNYNADLGIGEYIFTQIIKVSEDSEPEYETLDTVYVSTSNCQNAFVEFSAFSLPPSVCGGEFSSSHDSNYADSSGSDASGTYPIGTHTFSYLIKYGCGNKKYIKQTVIVEDSSKPSVYCMSQLATTLCGIDTDGDGIIDDGKVEIWAQDFDIGSSNTCGYGDLQYSFSPDVNHTAQTFTCADVGENELRMYVTDHLGNQSYCIVIIDIQNNSLDIPGCTALPTENENHDHTISGRLTSYSESIDDIAEVVIKTTELDTINVLTIDTSYITSVVDSVLQKDGTYNYINETVTLVTNHIDTIISHREKMVTLDNDGTYSIAHVGLMEDYILEPQLNTFIPENITTKDIEILSEHLWGKHKITNAYALLAADMDDSGVIDETDFYILMKVLRTQTYPAEITKYWYTLNIHHYMNTGEMEPEIYIDEFDSSISNNDFFAVMKGDLSAYINAENDDIDENVTGQIYTQHRIESSEPSTKSSIDAYPNPFSEELNVYIGSEIDESAEVEVLNVIGRVLFNKSVSLTKGQNIFQLDGEAFDQDGIYIINVKSESQRHSHPITVIKE